MKMHVESISKNRYLQQQIGRKSILKFALSSIWSYLYYEWNLFFTNYNIVEVKWGFPIFSKLVKKSIVWDRVCNKKKKITLKQIENIWECNKGA